MACKDDDLQLQGMSTSVRNKMFSGFHLSCMHVQLINLQHAAFEDTIVMLGFTEWILLHNPCIDIGPISEGGQPSLAPSGQTPEVVQQDCARRAHTEALRAASMTTTDDVLSTPGHEDPSEVPSWPVYVVLPAAGTGQRMGMPVPKQVCFFQVVNQRMHEPVRTRTYFHVSCMASVDMR